ncbi:alginate lyase family protein [Umezawaea endophytica]|uniref:Alginate lyase family protein n=1 Tax=Umezawaea endophytica TaxID=1654476 RepID=A0A9X2VJE9_9PSEU|nr:alginate lyase family protein [Umezawaea endophytica]MCS7477696.1 alginate lyase family protein [Umezawaea endophytica]
MRRPIAVLQAFVVVAATAVAVAASTPAVSAEPGPPAADGPVAHESLRDGGFENTTSAWTLSGAARRDQGGHGGTASLAVTSATGTSWEGATSASFAVDARRVASVRIGGFVKLDGVVPGATADNAAKISVAFVDATGKRTWKGVSLTGTQDWTERSDVHTVPAGTVSAFLSVALDRATGTARFDDLSVTPASWVNLVANPSFELTTPSTDTCPAPAWCTPYLSDTYRVDPTTASHGTRSLRIDASPTRKIGGFVTVPLDQKTWPLVHVSAKVRLDRVETADYTDFPGGLRVSIGFLYTDAAGASVYSASGLLNGVLTGSRDWTTISGSFRVPPLMTKLQIIPAIQNATGTAWVDDVRVTPESPWIAPDAETRKAADGTSATFLTTVTNRRAVADVLQLALDGPGTVTPAATPLLRPGQSATVRVAVPAGGSAVLTATPAGDAALAQPATFRVEKATASTGPPRTYTTPAQLDVLKRRIAGQDWAAKAFDTTVKAEADAWLDRPLDQPVDHGGWSGNFKCPGTNTSLEFDYRSPTLHRCPIDGSTHTGPLLDAAWVEIWHNNAAQAAADLGLAYRVTGDARYAVKARDILVYYAERFLSVPMSVLYGRVHYQSLDEAVAAIGLVDAYDLVRDALSEADRVDVEHNLLKPLAELVIAYPTVTSNFQAWTVAAVHGVGTAVDDAGLRKWALDDPQMGAEFLLDKARLADGWWWEGAASYHVYAVQALTQLAISARNAGERDYVGDERFRSMHTTLLPYLQPDLTIPAAGDGGTWGRRFGPSFTAMAEWAYAEYGSRDFATGLSLAYRNLARPRTDRWALRYGADAIPGFSGPRQTSATFDGLGETVLRSSDSPNLVPNGGLEEASVSNAAAPSFWRLDGASWADRGAFAGKRSLSVTGGRAEQEFPLDGTRVAHLGLQAVVRSTGTGRIDVTFLDAAGRDVRTATLPVQGVTSWTSKELGLDVPASARAVRIAVRGTLAVDDVDLFVDDLARNGGFEDGSTGWRAEGRAEVAPFGERGSAAAKVVGGPDRSGWTTDVPVSGGNVTSVRLDARTLSPLIPLRDQGGARVELSFVTPSGVMTPVSTAFRDPLGWRSRTLSADVPKDAIAARVSLVVENALGLALFDDVVLRFSGAVDPFQANALRLDHGVAGGTHGHADKLHLDIVGGGGNQSTDLGQIYGADNRDLTDNWYRESVSHNTVVVDGRSQDRNVRGALAFFGTTPRLKVVDAKADKPYASIPDVSLRRAELMTDEYAVDVFDATGTTPHRFDQSWHGLGELAVQGPVMGAPSCGEDCVLDPNDKDFGYDELRVVAEGRAGTGDWSARWTTPNAVLEARALEPVATSVVRTTGPGVATDGKRIPFVLARRDGLAATRFTTLLETRSAAAPGAVTAATHVAQGHVRVDLTGDRRDDVLFDGGYALVRRAGGKPVSVDLLDRSSVAVDGREWIRVTGGGAPKVLRNASAVYDGTTLRLAVHRTADRVGGGPEVGTGRVTMSVYAPGIRTVELNNEPARAVVRNGDFLTVTFTVG